MEEATRNIIIIGSGPAGLTAGIYAGRAGLKPLIIGGRSYGGQLMLTTHVENYPGFESIMGPELMEKMIDHSKKFGTEIIYKDVIKVDLSERPFKVYVEESLFQTKALIIATGAKAKMLGLPSEERLLGHGVSVCATCDGAFFKERKVAVVGAGDTAMEEAIFLTKYASKVYVLVRKGKDEIRASKIMISRAQENEKIEFLYNTEVKEILGEEKVSGVRIINNKTSEEADLNVEGLFIAIGYNPASDTFKGIVNIDELGYIQPIERTHTNVEGVFVAGDVEDRHYRQAITAAGDGCKAAIDAEKWLASKGEVDMHTTNNW
ncbi:thioredoxin-disulfide reductase [Candidatus Dojkabacteria bacterium]|nr:thioredoxin-disulfide reductase [Candidatus Dojkabacteria bacterium]